MGRRIPVGNLGLAALCLAALAVSALLVRFVSEGTLLAIGLYAAVFAAYLGWSHYVVESRPAYDRAFSPAHLVVALACCTVSAVALGWIQPSLLAFVHFAAVTLVFVYWVVVLAALVQAVVGRDGVEPASEYPSVAVIVPAYNEEGYVSRTVESLLDARYPDGKKEIVVVDDGSTDGTYDEARAYESETVTVVRKENGGKYSALNYGLLFSDAELVVTVDADSVVARDALLDVVAPFEANPNVGAVASDVRIFNRDSRLTRCQTLEYVFGINVYRRVFDRWGTVSIVPGCLGAYRRSVLEEVCEYDPETLTEDFDTTLKVLKQGYEVRLSEAVVYTEAPDTWRDLYNQRLRWYRGNVMTVRKHLLDAAGPGDRYLRRVHLPLALVTMVLAPFASWVIFGVVGYLVVTTGVAAVVAPFAIFTAIVVVGGLVATEIGDENPRYALYAPLFVVGYKHFHDLVMVKSVLDVLRDRELGWTDATRVDQRESAARDLAVETSSDRTN